MSFFDNTKPSTYSSSGSSSSSPFNTQNPSYTSQNQGFTGQSNFPGSSGSGYPSYRKENTDSYKPPSFTGYDSFQHNYDYSKAKSSSDTSGGFGNIDKPANLPKSDNAVLDPENIRYYHLFNLKKSPYKLKHYLYFSEDLNINFDVTNYNRMDIKMGRPPLLRHYIRFYDMKYDYELNPRGKHYGDMYTLTDKNQSQNIVYSKEYRGKYANQLDYINFKVYMTQEKYK